MKKIPKDILKNINSEAKPLLKEFNLLLNDDLSNRDEDLVLLSKIGLQALEISKIFKKFDIPILEFGYSCLDKMTNSMMFGNMPYSIALSFILHLNFYLKQAVASLFKSGVIPDSINENINKLNTMLSRVENLPRPQVLESGELVKPEISPKIDEEFSLPENIQNLDGTFPNLSTESLEFIDEFFEEFFEHLKSLEEQILKLENNPDDKNSINILFRIFHTIKGAAGFFGLDEISIIAHRSETLLEKCRDNKIKMSNEIINTLLLVIDTFNKLIINLVTRVKILKKEIKEYDISKISITDLLVRLNSILSGKTEIVPENSEKNFTIKNDTNIKNNLTADPLKKINQDDETISIFLQESIEDVESLNEQLLELEHNNNDRELLNKIFRKVHKLKSGADALSFDSLARLMHNLEELLSALRDNKIQVNEKIINLSLKCADKYYEGLNSIKNSEYPKLDIDAILSEIQGILGIKKNNTQSKQELSKSTGGGDNLQKELSSDSIRVDLQKLDKLMNQTGELVIAKASITQLINNLKRMYKENKSDLTKFRQTVNRLAEESQKFDRLVSQIQNSVMSTRMVTVDTLFKKYVRIIRDLARENNKNISMSISGQDTELDKHVIEELSDPLTHMVRNSIDHGIEAPEKRIKSGKNPQGKILFSAYREGNAVCISIKDDGAGLDIDKIKEKAIEKKLFSKSELESKSNEEIYKIIFQPGFSTAEKITNISGRGVGMDVVRERIEKLKGTINIKTKKGIGTEFIIRLPLTLAVIDAMLFTVREEIYAISLENVTEIVEIKKNEIYKIEKILTIKLRDNVIPVIKLNEVIGIKEVEELNEINNVMIIAQETNKIGILVSKLIGKESIVIKSLDKSFKNIKGISGATILGDGRVSLILDAAGLLECAAKFKIKS